MTESGDGMLNGILDEVLPKSGGHALAEAAHASTPLVRAISQLLEACAGAGPNCSAGAECMFYPTGAVRVRKSFGRLRRSSHQKTDSYAPNAHPL